MARAPRADAVRNRTRILEAARDQITRHGPGVGMDEIAVAAGVAVGTLYRHFPTKTDLVAAVIGEYMDRVADAAEAAASRQRLGSRAADELLAFIRGVIDASATNNAAKAAAESLGATTRNADAEARAAQAVAALIKAGQKDGDLRRDATVDDIYLLVSTAPYDQPAAARERWLALVLPGLSPSSSTRRHPHR